MRSHRFLPPTCTMLAGASVVVTACSSTSPQLRSGADAAPEPADAPATQAALPTTKHLAVSGIYPHLAAFNDSSSKIYGECGIGAVVPWAGSLWYLTYPPHERRGSADKLYQVDADLNLTVRAESVGGTHAGRLIHRESRQLVLGPYFIDEAGRVRAVDVKSALPGRLTAVARHLTEPDRKVYYFDMEGPIWEVDVRTLEPRRLFVKPVPGWHGKGAWTGQGRLVVANNGESSTADLDNLTWELPRGEWPRGPEDAGALAEFDGKAWTLVSRRQHTDVTGPGGLEGEQKPDDPIWSMGWDKRSLIVHVRHGGAWQRYRVPKGSYTYDPRHGWYTEWPRIRAIGGGRHLMNMHGTFFDFPSGFRPGQTAGLRPLSTHLVYVPDFAEWNGFVVIAADDASVLQNQLVGRAQSNLRFVRREQLATDFGPALGWGGVWVRDAVKAGVASDPLLVGGYAARTLHLIAHEAPGEVTFVIEADERGDGEFREWQRVSVPPRGYVPYLLPADTRAQWLRLRTDRDATVTAYMHAGPQKTQGAPAGAGLDALAPVEKPAAFTGGLLRPAAFSRDLQFLARTVGPDGTPGPEAHYEIDERLRFRRVDDATKIAALHQVADVKADFEVDAASVIVRGRDGKRWRLPKGPAAFEASSPLGPLRGLREVTSERFVANYNGTFYEIPRGSDNASPDFARMKPIASHRARITDFCSWRGMLVLAGVSADATAGTGHIFRAEGDGHALWFGAVDDLYRFGPAVGEGGPWRDTEVQPAAPSDPYLMTGYGKKTLTLAHDGAAAVTFTVEVDPLADGAWLPYRRLTVDPGRPTTHEFPTGFAAHWVRLQTDKPCRATATLRYE